MSQGGQSTVGFQHVVSTAEFCWRGSKECMAIEDSFTIFAALQATAILAKSIKGGYDFSLYKTRHWVLLAGTGSFFLLSCSKSVLLGENAL